jgi:hypothetical protein
MSTRREANAATRYLRGERLETCALHEAIHRFSKRCHRQWRRQSRRAA